MNPFDIDTSRSSRREKSELFPIERIRQIEQDLDPFRPFGM